MFKQLKAADSLYFNLIWIACEQEKNKTEREREREMMMNILSYEYVDVK